MGNIANELSLSTIFLQHALNNANVLRPKLLLLIHGKLFVCILWLQETTESKPFHEIFRTLALPMTLPLRNRILESAAKLVGLRILSPKAVWGSISEKHFQAIVSSDKWGTDAELPVDDGVDLRVVFR